MGRTTPMEPVLPPHRELCLRCRRPASVCWCDALTPVPSTTHVVFLQHPREARVPVSTCRMAHLSLPNSELHIGLGAVGKPALEAVCAQPGTAVLFPSEGAVDVKELATAPKNLIVVDGTWANAKKVVTKCPVLSKLPRVAFTPEQPGNYRIRKEPEAHCVSTIEAVVHVLEHLEHAPGRFTPVLKVFDRMVTKQLDYIQANHLGSRHRRHRLRNSVKVDPLAPLREQQPNLVVLFGEANAWPLDAPNRPVGLGEPELIQLVAQRLATGVRFEALLQPVAPWSPSVSFHLDVPAGALANAEARPSGLVRWREWLTPEDVLVGWGHFCVDLLSHEGLAPRPFIDLRAVMAREAGHRPGSVETCASALGATLAEGQGRAARRLESLAVVTRSLLQRVRATSTG